MRDDLKAAVRSFRSSKSFTAAALLVLILGIGATTAIFSVVDAVVLRGLPFDEHDRLVAVGERYTGPNRSLDPGREPGALSAVAPQNFVDWVAGPRVFESMAAIGSGWLTLHEPGGEPESLVPQRVTAGFFSVLRVAPALGRPFTTENETLGRDRVAILSDGLWRRRFGGTACAVVVAWWAVEVLRTSMPDNVPRVTTIALNMRVLVASACVSLFTGLLFGIVPALQLSRPNVSNALKDGARTGAAAARQRLRSILVVAEVALAVVLLVGAALFIGSFVSLIRIDPGFSPDHLLTAQISPRVETRTQPRNWGPALADVVDRISQIPGVRHAAMISGGIPLNGSTSLTTMTRPGKTYDLNDPDSRVSVRRVTPRYHQALQIPLRRGRLFDETDREGNPATVILNEGAAKKYFPGEDPLGQIVDLNGERTVVGIVGDVHQTSLEMDSRAEAYIPLQQSRVPGAELVVRTSANPYDVLPAVKSAVFAVLPDVPLRNVSTMEELIARRLAQRRLNMLLLGLFGLLGLVISAVGIYGLMAYLVTQRTREIGVRIALGASRSNVVAMVLLNAAALVGCGVVLGSVTAWYLSAASKAFLFRLQPTDPRAFIAATASLLLAALIASVIPARRAASVDPMVALRTE
jgi:putative ABC transport system permease protein